MSSASWPQATELVCARVSSLPTDDLVVVDPAGQQLHVISQQSPAGGPAGDAPTVTQTVDLDVESGPVAVLPMRLNEDALSDLVVLRAGQAAPAAVLTAAVATFTVTSTGDAGPGSLRQAIMDANSSQGADSIFVNIQPPGSKTINLLSPLPPVTDAVTIDGINLAGELPSGLTEINGAGAGSNADGLDLVAPSCVVRRLVINRFSTGNGIRIGPGGNSFIQGNFIGTDATGLSARPNSNGVSINASSNLILGNLISGNIGDGIVISDGAFAPANGNQVQHNFIGVDINGGKAIPNNVGVLINTPSQNEESAIMPQAMNNLIGGSRQQSGNLISGNCVGIAILTAGNFVENNLIGTDGNGSVALGNISDGLFVGGNSNTILDNLISGNGGDGVLITGDGNNLQGNFIGTIFDGSSALKNAGNGVRIGGSLSGCNQGRTESPASGTAGNRNSIFGTDTDLSIIAFNGEAGVFVFAGNENEILQNSIHDNTGLGIDLAPIGPNKNNDCGSTSGANLLQNFPILTSAGATANSVTVAGTLNSTANSAFAIEFFANDSCDPSGNGEGQTFVGTTKVITDGNCNASFTVTLNASGAAGKSITATATDLLGNTSEFSACTPATPRGADLQITKTIANPPPSGAVVPGSSITYLLTVTNNGPDPASSVVVTDNLPPQLTFQSASPAPSGGAGNSRTFNFPSLGVGAANSQTIRIQATVNSGVTDCTVTNTASVDVSLPNPLAVPGSSSDPNPANNIASADINVLAMSVSPSSLEFPAILPGGSASQTISIVNSNNCPRDVTFESILRTGPDLSKISDPNDSSFFKVTRADGSAVTLGTSVQIGPAQTAGFTISFNPVFPPRATPPRNTGLPASQVLPALLTSALRITSNGVVFPVNLTARVAPIIKLLNGVTFSKQGDAFTIGFDVYAPDPGVVEKATYILLDNNQNVVAPADTESLATAIGQANLAKGQSFHIDQTGSGMNGHPEVARVRVTVFKSDNSLSDTAVSNAAASAAANPAGAVGSQPAERAEKKRLVFSRIRLKY
jgi:uncharacterized repeat protein (TIGR01451 family)